MSMMLQKINELRAALVSLSTKLYTGKTQLQTSRHRVRLLLSKVQLHGSQNPVNTIKVMALTTKVDNEEDVQDLMVMLFDKEMGDDENPFTV